ncbi:MAG: hypothetical protein A2790_08975 [Phenylobacterium sp. RIFCSPHIGHO2_01_FULL_69_31]|uniref:hypothetical protein n=1 Tax=Phenylobacterium sp. RIFCSPHIGHO2_01_FULL_69_31 TaxID=1801944 RepID=UPI0008CFE7B4|nr:hypothetical protein [Phenylobacterium sp. RIFCSPHIGHO2_01_FULL_69_31]OHB30138.1 MAG: hypothetical protein A2790_08975 [Phenylobacterium sp. RIFCSPHIGHO2_01_FULL_69_31]
MSAREAEVAEEVVHTLDESVARFVFEEGVRHITALQTASHALDARATQVATIMFAAAAVAASVISTAGNLADWLAAGAIAFFVWGGIISFRGVRSDEFRAPGLAPAWWEGALVHAQTFNLKDALAWAAKQQQIAIDHICEENLKRSEALNASLRCACIAAVLVAIAAALKFWPAVSSFLAKL